MTEWRREAFLEALAAGASVKAAAEAAGLPRQRFYEAGERDLEFEEAWREALARARERS